MPSAIPDKLRMMVRSVLSAILETEPSALEKLTMPLWFEINVSAFRWLLVSIDQKFIGRMIFPIHEYEIESPLVGQGTSFDVTSPKRNVLLAPSEMSLNVVSLRFENTPPKAAQGELGQVISPTAPLTPT